METTKNSDFDNMTDNEVLLELLTFLMFPRLVVDLDDPHIDDDALEMDEEIDEDIPPQNEDDVYYTVHVWTDDAIFVHYVNVGHCESDQEAQEEVEELMRQWYPAILDTDDPRWEISRGKLSVVVN